VDDRGVVERVRDDRVVLAQQGFEQAAVGVEAGRVEDGVVLAEEVRDGLFQPLVQVLGAADEAHAGHAEAVRVERRLGRLDHRRVVGQAEVVVGAEVEHRAAVVERDLRRLRTGDDALGLEQALGADRIELFRVAGGRRGGGRHGGFHRCAEREAHSSERPARTALACAAWAERRRRRAPPCRCGRCRCWPRCCRCWWCTWRGGCRSATVGSRPATRTGMAASRSAAPRATAWATTCSGWRCCRVRRCRRCAGWPPRTGCDATPAGRCARCRGWGWWQAPSSGCTRPSSAPAAALTARCSRTASPCTSAALAWCCWKCCARWRRSGRGRPSTSTCWRWRWG